MDEETTYLIIHEDGTERKITVPSDWKVTFGPAAKGMNAGKNPSYKVPLCLRFYENETRQRAIFTDVVSFRDLSIKTEIKVVTTQEKAGYMECEGKRKATTFQARSEEWIDPDDLAKVPALPSGSNVEGFDVEFGGIKEEED